MFDNMTERDRKSRRILYARTNSAERLIEALLLVPYHPPCHLPPQTLSGSAVWQAPADQLCEVLFE
jgi:hypothetical protein